MPTSSLSLMLLTVLSGLCFSVMGFMYQLATRRNVTVLHVACVSSGSGALVFGACLLTGDLHVPASVWGWAVLGGGTQYLSMLLLRFALAHGPLSALWSAMNLAFIPAVLYAGVVLREPITGWHLAALAAAIGCVLTAASLQQQTTPDGNPEKTASRLRYGLALTGLLLANSGTYIGMKVLSMPAADGSNPLALHTNAYLTGVYACVFACLMTDQILHRSRLLHPFTLCWTGGITACGSMAGMLLYTVAASLPAAVASMVNTVAAMLFTALGATLFLGELRSRRWYAAQALAILAVVLAQGDALLGLLRQWWR